MSLRKELEKHPGSSAADSPASAVERVAKAIYEADPLVSGPRTPDVRIMSWDEADQLGYGNYTRKMASAAIAALRTTIDRGKLEEIRSTFNTIIGLLDDPTGGTHVPDMRAAGYTARVGAVQCDALLEMIGGLKDETR